jgi:hypothetical protein
VPTPVLDRVRRLVRDDRALRADAAARKTYTERLGAATERTTR